MPKLGWKILAIALGVALAGCGEEDTEDTGDTGPIDQPEYGVEDVAWVAPTTDVAPDQDWRLEEA